MRRKILSNDINPTDNGRAGHLFVNSKNSAFIIGGYSEGPLLDIWQCKESKWTEVKQKVRNNISPLDRIEYSGCVLGNCIMIFGGIQYSSDSGEVSILNDLWLFDVNSKKGNWVCLFDESPAPERSNHVCIALDDDRMLIHGGDCMGVRGDTWIYIKSANLWLEIARNHPNIPCSRHSHSIALWTPLGDPTRKCVVVFGGLTSSPQSPREEMLHLNDMWLLDYNSVNPLSWSWQRVDCIGFAPSPRDSPAMVQVRVLTRKVSSILLQHIM